MLFNIFWYLTNNFTRVVTVKKSNNSQNITKVYYLENYLRCSNILIFYVLVKKEILCYLWRQQSFYFISSPQKNSMSVPLISRLKSIAQIWVNILNQLLSRQSSILVSHYFWKSEKVLIAYIFISENVSKGENWDFKFFFFEYSKTLGD